MPSSTSFILLACLMLATIVSVHGTCVSAYYATADVTHLFPSGNPVTIANFNNLFGDPAPGYRKDFCLITQDAVGSPIQIRTGITRETEQPFYSAVPQTASSGRTLTGTIGTYAILQADYGGGTVTYYAQQLFINNGGLFIAANGYNDIFGDPVENALKTFNVCVLWTDTDSTPSMRFTYYEEAEACNIVKL